MNRALAVLSTWLAACAAPAPGRISVEVYRGLASQVSGSFQPSVHLVVDATRSMGRGGGEEVAPLEAARVKATELLGLLPGNTRAALHVLGSQPQPGESCGSLESSVPLASVRSLQFADALDALHSRGEASTAAGLAALAASLRADGSARQARVVLFTDLDASCGGDLCDAAATLVAAGAWLDLVALGDAPTPACLEALRPSAREAGRRIAALSRPAPGWRLGAPGSAAGDVGPVSGTSGAHSYSAPAGEWLVRIALERPTVIGPLRIEPERVTRVRVLDFAAVPPRFAWEIVDEGR